MDDLISRQAAIDKINERQRKLIYCFGLENDMVKIMDIARSIIIAMPSADVQPVRHGRWEKDPRSKRTRCSECYSVVPRDDYRRECLSDYCSVCGARMDGEQND